MSHSVSTNCIEKGKLTFTCIINNKEFTYEMDAVDVDFVASSEEIQAYSRNNKLGFTGYKENSPIMKLTAMITHGTIKITDINTKVEIQHRLLEVL